MMGKYDRSLNKGQAMDYMYLLFRIGYLIRRLGSHFLNRVVREIFEHFPALKKRSCMEVESFQIDYSRRRHLPYLFELCSGEYEAFIIELLKKAIRPGMTVLDIGAHIGFYTLLAARELGSNGKIYAFEPDVRNLPFLRSNITRNGFIKHVIVVPKAVSSQSGETRFYLDKGIGLTSSLFKGYRKINTESIVEVIALDDFLEESLVVDVIKMDIEGAELLALKGMRRTIDRASQGLIMFVEINPLALRVGGASANELVKQLQGLGFQVRLIDEESQRLVEIVSDGEAGEIKIQGDSANLYCVRVR